MSKPRKIKLSVPNPCSENWDKMTPMGDGKYCTHCANIISDFSTFSDTELVAYLSNIKGKVCGQFANTQLNREIAIYQPSNTPIFHRLLLGAALTAGVAGATYGQSLTTPSTSGANAAGQINSKKVAGSNKSIITDTSGIISGKIIDAKMKHPLAGAKMIIELDSVHYTTAYTDSTGHYSINIPTSYLNKQITLFPRMDDYDNTFKTVVISQFPMVFNFRLHESKIDRKKTMGYLMM